MREIIKLKMRLLFLCMIFFMLFGLIDAFTNKIHLTTATYLIGLSAGLLIGSLKNDN